MSSYTIAVPWSGKDTLSNSDPAKVVSGSDFNTEFTAVQLAVNSKADLNGSAAESFSATTAPMGTDTTQVATTAFVSANVIPVGTKMAFFQASAPTGWTQDTTHNNKVLRVVSGTGGGNGGTWDVSSGVTTSSTGAHTHTGPSHTHSIPSHSHGDSFSVSGTALSPSQMPSHTHSVTLRKMNWDENADNGGGQGQYLMDSGGLSHNVTSGNAGSGGTHTHSLPGSVSSGGSGTSGSGGTGNTSSNGNHTHTISAPKYIDMIICTRD